MTDADGNFNITITYYSKRHTGYRVHISNCLELTTTYTKFKNKALGSVFYLD